MKRKLVVLFFIALFVLMPKVSASTLYGKVTSANGQGLNLRGGAGTSYSKVGWLDEVSIITIIDSVSTNDNTNGCSGKWYKIEYQSSYAYGCSDFVTLIDTTVTTDFEATLSTFPTSYRPFITFLHGLYPNAEFIAYNTKLDFNTAVNNETTLGKSLIWDSNDSRDGLKHLGSYDYLNDKFYNEYSGGGPNWYAANEKTIAYYLDPRNFLNEKRIFMFESLSYNPLYHNLAGVESTFKKSFMENEKVDGGTSSFASVVYDLSVKNNLNPYYIASRMIQETGYSRSDLVKGTYPSYPQFNGYYNFFNYGASGNDVVYNGLNYAYNNWDKGEYGAIVGGVKKIGNNYISIGQDTGYFQKWDVICNVKTSTGSCYNNQYMQNIEAPSTEGAKNYNSYYSTLGNNMYSSYYIFTIPVYENMPASTSLPSTANPNNYLSSLTINGTSVANFTGSNTSYTIKLSNSIKSINIDATALTASKGATVSGNGNIDISNKDVIPIVVTAANGDKMTYNITIIKTDDDAMSLADTIGNIKSGNIKDDYISGLTNANTIIDAIKASNSEALVTVTDLGGNVVTNGPVGSGYKVTIEANTEKKTFEVIIYGDSNGDTDITILDLLYIQKYLLGSTTLSGSKLKACDINHDEKVNILDLLYVQKHLLGSYIINQ